jgi:RHS repeat-associated protein
MLTDKLYTGQREMADLGLYHYNARFYSPYINHFLSADTVIPDFTNSQSLNRYAYVLNNPIKLIDPTGHKCVGKEGECEDENGHPINGADQGSQNKDSQNKDLKASEKGVDFILYFEGPWYDHPYNDMGGNCTIGFGHLLLNDKCTGALRKYYREYPLSYSGALNFLSADLANAEADVRDSITVKLGQEQFDALVSYVFNSGGESNQPFHTKGIPELINSGQFEAAAAAIASGPITSGDPPLTSDKLIERRQAEADLFLLGTFGKYAP